MDNEDFYITVDGYKCFTENITLKEDIVVKVIVNIVLTGLTQILIK